MYSEQRPLFPRLHRCYWCKKRLSKKMPIIAKWGFDLDGGYVDCYFCCKDCAAACHADEKARVEREQKLNIEILEGEDGGN